MKYNYNIKLVDKIAKTIPGEQTVLLCVDDVIQEDGFTKYKSLTPHPNGIPISSIRDEDGQLYIIQKDGLCHTLVTGSTGCGKSLRFLTNLLFNLDASTSVIITDIKGELYRNTAEYLKGIYGDDNVKYMDFVYPRKSEILFNPMASIAKKYMEAELYPNEKLIIQNEALAELRQLFDKLFPIRSTQDVSWDVGANSLIYGVAVGLLEDLLLSREEEARTGRHRVLPTQFNFEALSSVLCRFDVTENLNDYGFFSTRRSDSKVWQYVRSMVDLPRNTVSCYMQLAQSYINDFSYPDVRDLTTVDNFDIASLGDKPQVVFLNYDISNIRMKGIVNQYVVKALDALKNKSISYEKPLPVSVQVILDEFPTLQANDIYATIFSVGRGWNIFLNAILQDFTQLETTYGAGMAQQMRNNCNLLLFLGTNDLNTAKKVQQQIGKHTVSDLGNCLQGDVKFIESYIVSEDELLHRMNPGDAYITINNHMPVKGYFELYFDCKEYTQYAEAEKNNVPIIDFKDKRYHYDASWITKKFGSFRR